MFISFGIDGGDKSEFEIKVDGGDSDSLSRQVCLAVTQFFQSVAHG